MYASVHSKSHAVRQLRCDGYIPWGMTDFVSSDLETLILFTNTQF
jgi:hypothetical protein